MPTIGRSSLSLIQLTNSSPGQRPQNHTPMASMHQNNMTGNRGPRPLDQVTCYKVSHLSISSIFWLIHLIAFLWCPYIVYIFYWYIVPTVLQGLCAGLLAVTYWSLRWLSDNSSQPRNSPGCNITPMANYSFYIFVQKK